VKTHGLKTPATE